MEPTQIKQISLKQQKKLSLEILKKIHSICEENHLHYFLCGGSLIGAIRHGGYIPWDDDIDIMLPREDYEKLIQLINRSRCRLYAFSDRTGSDYPYAYAKVSDKRTWAESEDKYAIRGMGVSIDLFPYDGISDSAHITKMQYRMVSSLQLFRNGLIHTENRNEPLPFYKAVLLKLDLLLMRWVATWFKTDKSSKVGCVVAVKGGIREVIDKPAFENRIKFPFEDAVFYVPAGYDTYLRNVYGDYMQLPPEKDRRQANLTKAYWRRDLTEKKRGL